MDPGPAWKDLLEYVWAILLIPLAGLWKKVNSSVSKTELNEAMQVRDKQADNVRLSTLKLFENAELDRRMLSDRFERMQREIHKVHTDVLTQLNRVQSGSRYGDPHD